MTKKRSERQIKREEVAANFAAKELGLTVTRVCNVVAKACLIKVR